MKKYDFPEILQLNNIVGEYMLLDYTNTEAQTIPAHRMLETELDEWLTHFTIRPDGNVTLHYMTRDQAEIARDTQAVRCEPTYYIEDHHLLAFGDLLNFHSDIGVFRFYNTLNPCVTDQTDQT